MLRWSLLITATLGIAITSDCLAGQVVHHRDAIPGRYIVLLDPTTVPQPLISTAVRKISAAFNLKVETIWLNGAVGFVCSGVPDRIVTALATDSRIKLIEDDFIFHSTPIISATQYTCVSPCAPADYMWNLDRIDQIDYHSNDGQYHMCPEGRSVYAYMLDTGVRSDHREFNLNEPFNRVRESREFVSSNNPGGLTDNTNGCASNSNQWHGTSTASILAGTRVGGAKTNIVSLRIFDCFGNGFLSSVLNAINWIGNPQDSFRDSPGVVNWSGGFPPDLQISSADSLKSAIICLTSGNTPPTGSGCVVPVPGGRRAKPMFVAANNFSADACKFYPANLAYTNVDKPDRWVFVAGGTSFGPADRNDYRWQLYEADGTTPRIGVDPNPLIGPSGSNGGRCVSVYAPATDILGARNTGPDDYARASGTSYASPLTAAVAARYMEKFGLNPSTKNDVTAIYDYLLNTAASTGTPIYNVNTPEFWMCAPSGFYRTNPGQCASDGQNGTTIPIHFESVGNTSNAGILYSNLHIDDPNCPDLP
jgi:Subtilase family.